MLRTAGVVLAMMSFAFPALSQARSAGRPTPPASLLVLAKKDQAVAIVDPETLEVVARVPVGPEPHEVIASQDGRTAWVSNYLNGSDHTITVVDLVKQQVVKTIDLGPLWGPHGLYLSQGRPYFTAERAKVIGRLDPAQETVDWVLGTGQIGTHMLWVSRDGHRIVSVNVGSGTLSLMQQKTIVPEDEYPHMLSKQGGVVTRGQGGPQVADWDVTVVKVGGYPEGFDVLADSDGNPQTIWVANAVEGTISVVDFKSRSVVRTLDAHLPTANRLRFTPDGTMAVVTRQKSGQVAILRVPDGHQVASVDVGTGAAGVLISPDGSRAFVSCSPDNWVRVIDLKTMQVVGKIEPGDTPDGLAWAARP